MDAARALPGRPPDLTTVARAGCVFRDRCPFAVAVCAETEPPLEAWVDGRRRACHVEPSTVLTGTTGTPAAVGEPA